MQVIHRPFFKKKCTPINSNFQISSLADFCFLPINSGFSQEIHLYSFEIEDGWVCAWPWEEEPSIKVQPLTMPQIIWCELNKFFPCSAPYLWKKLLIIFLPHVLSLPSSAWDCLSGYVPLKSRALSTREPKFAIHTSPKQKYEEIQH